MNLNSTVTCGIDSYSASNVRQRLKGEKVNLNINNKTETAAIEDFALEAERNYWQDLELFNDEASYHSMSSTVMAKWDDYRLWDNFAADPTRREAAVERIVFNANRRQIKPIDARCSLASKTSVVESVVEEEKMEIEADEEPSRCSNLILYYYGQFKKMSKAKYK